MTNHSLFTYGIKLIISSIAVFFASYLIKGVHIDVYTTAILVAVVLSFLNLFLKPMLVLLTIPVTLFSFGLFLLVINAFIIILTDYLVEGFRVDSFWWALLFSIVFSVITSLMSSFYQPKTPANNEYSE